jgi:hypothetical protein
MKQIISRASSGGGIGQAGIQYETSILPASYLLRAVVVIGLFFNSEDGSGIFLHNVG